MANCELAEASTRSRPPARPRPVMVSGGRPSAVETSAPAARSTSRRGADWAPAQGFFTVEDHASRSSAARRRRGNVASSPRDGRSVASRPPIGRPEVPVTSARSPELSMRAPRPRRPSVIAKVSSLASRRLRRLLPSARAGDQEQAVRQALARGRLQAARDRTGRDQHEHRTRKQLQRARSSHW